MFLPRAVAPTLHGRFFFGPAYVYRLVQKKRNRGLPVKFLSVEGFVVPKRFTVETAMVELVELC